MSFDHCNENGHFICSISNLTFDYIKSKQYKHITSLIIGIIQWKNHNLWLYTHLN